MPYSVLVWPPPFNKNVNHTNSAAPLQIWLVRLVDCPRLVSPLVPPQVSGLPCQRVCLHVPLSLSFPGSSGPLLGMPVRAPKGPRVSPSVVLSCRPVGVCCPSSACPPVPPPLHPTPCFPPLSSPCVAPISPPRRRIFEDGGAYALRTGGRGGFSKHVSDCRVVEDDELDNKNSKVKTNKNDITQNDKNEFVHRTHDEFDVSCCVADSLNEGKCRPSHNICSLSLSVFRSHDESSHWTLK